MKYIIIIIWIFLISYISGEIFNLNQDIYYFIITGILKFGGAFFILNVFEKKQKTNL
ncbi:hypothetical protein [Carnobacterium sp.]|uniref:hypothetical protein n=1 Tax=Carnobacterium sp. TaxID=48221 RepID=UPI00388D5EB4